MSDTVANLEPAAVWRHFAAISAIPRCSRNEAAVRAYVEQQAAAAGLESKTDAAGNIVVRRPASTGREDAPIVALQGHLDMVCEKNLGVTHDFSRDPISLILEDGWVRAAETTLGADNGIAVAMMLALLESDEALGPLECLFTVDEESGLTGALKLDPALLSARVLINVDSEEEGTITIGCAGGRNTHIELPLVREQRAGAETGMRLTLTGLRGGHSGINIGEQRGNAIQLGARLLDTLLGAVPEARIGEVTGGDKHNAIPREFRLTLALPSAQVAACELALEAFLDTARTEMGADEPELRIDREAIEAPSKTLVSTAARTLTDLLLALPHGVLGMSRDVPGLVETSTNLAAIRTTDGGVDILTSQRSSRRSLIEWAARTVSATATLAGATVKTTDAYPGWPPDPSSPLLSRAVRVHESAVGRAPEVVAVHAGLECGVIGDRIDGMDMISIGPDQLGAHTPTERLSVASTERTWRYLVALLRSIAEDGLDERGLES